MYTITEIDNRTWQITELDYNTFYYLEGQERGLLIDTGVGAGNMQNTLDTIATKPYDVVLTHGHCSHAGGIFGMDHVFFNLRDEYLTAGLSEDARRHYIENLGKISAGMAPGQSADDLVKSGQLPRFTHADTGYLFRLGGRDVIVRATPGHTPGSICLFDQGRKLLFVGDTIAKRMLLLSDAEDRLEQVQKWRDQTEWIFKQLRTMGGIYMGHAGRAQAELLEELPQLMDELLAGKRTPKKQGNEMLTAGEHVQVHFHMLG